MSGQLENTLMRIPDDHLPPYRQEEIFRREGIFLTRQKLASRVIIYYERLQVPNVKGRC